MFCLFVLQSQFHESLDYTHCKFVKIIALKMFTAKFTRGKTDNNIKLSASTRRSWSPKDNQEIDSNLIKLSYHKVNQINHLQTLFSCQSF